MTLSEKARSALAGHLQRAIEGEVLIDSYSRGRYATDASPYQSFPAAIVLPKTQTDIAAALRLAWEAGLPVTARGGGTGRAGQAVGEGLILDTSKYLTRLLYYDASAQTCIVEPGITLAALNAALKPERVWLPIEMASAGSATIGGMMATDAIGGRTLRYGRMRDNITACDAVLADGSEAGFGEIAEDFGHNAGAAAEAGLMLDLLEAAEGREALLRDWPGTALGLPGYNAAALLSGDRPANAAAFLAGSEGTLAVAKRIELKLARRPRSRAMGVCHFPAAGIALRAVPHLLTLGPTAIELTAPPILQMGLAGAEAEAPARRILAKAAKALLFVEFMEGNRVANARKLKELADLMARLGHVRSVSEVIGAAAQNAVRRAHDAGLSKIYGMTRLPAPFVPLSALAISVERLEEAAEALGAAFERHGWTVFFHGHAGSGVLHLHPWLGSQPENAGSRAAAAEASEALRALAGHLPARTAMASPDRR